MHSRRPSSSSTSVSFLELSSVLMKNARGLSRRTEAKRFRSMFGTSPVVCAVLWRKLNAQFILPNGSEPIHLLWSLLFLKVYATEAVNKAIAGVDEKTFRKWAWCFVKHLSSLKVIKWSARKVGSSVGNCKVSVDGTDVRILEPSPFSPKWYSHKFKGPGLRYELGVSISTGHIVWVNGPYPCGTYSDLRIFRHKMKTMLGSNERVIADGGYPDARCSTSTNYMGVDSKLHAEIRARHETANVANITQTIIEVEEPLFDI